MCRYVDSQSVLRGIGFGPLAMEDSEDYRFVIEFPSGCRNLNVLTFSSMGRTRVGVVRPDGGRLRIYRSQTAEGNDHVVADVLPPIGGANRCQLLVVYESRTPCSANAWLHLKAS